MIAVQVPASRVRVTYRRRGTGWEGVLKAESGDVVAACGHFHRNRDQDTQLHPSARGCAVRLAIAQGRRAEASWGSPWWIVPDGFASDEEYLDNVECSGCGQTRLDAMSCELALRCEERGCSCVVDKVQSCDWTDGSYACAEHTPSHRGCPECDPPERDDR